MLGSTLPTGAAKKARIYAGGNSYRLLRLPSHLMSRTANPLGKAREDQHFD